MRVAHDVVHIGFLPRRMPHIEHPANDTLARIRRRTRPHLAIRRHMPPDLGKEPLNAEMRLQPLPLVMEDFHCVKDQRLQTKRLRDLGFLTHRENQAVQTRKCLFGQQLNLTSLRILEVTKTLG
jgi:hypothetical protein